MKTNDKSIIIGMTGVMIGIGATFAGKFINDHFINKTKNDAVKEKVRKYNAIEFGEHLNNEEYNTIFHITEKYLNEQGEEISSCFMQELNTAREFFDNRGFIRDMLIFTLNADIPDVDKLKSIKSILTKLEDIMNSYSEYHTRFLNNKKECNDIDNINMRG